MNEQTKHTPLMGYALAARLLQEAEDIARDYRASLVRNESKEVTSGIEENKTLLATNDRLSAENKRLREALGACHDCLQANFASPATVDGRRATVAMNEARKALEAKG